MDYMTLKEAAENWSVTPRSWYIKYPSQKAALNAILLTDFVLSLKSKNEAEDIEKE